MKPQKKILRRTDGADSGRITAVDCIEESFNVLRANFATVMPLYLVGTVPFVLGLIYFVNDMSQSADAWSTLPVYSTYLAMLFVWKCSFQAMFCGKVMDALTAYSRPRVEARVKPGVMALKQCVVQSPGLFVMFLSGFMPLILPWTMAFFNTFSTLSAIRRESLVKTCLGAVQTTRKYPLEIYRLCLILCALFLIVALNAGILIFLVPGLLKTFFGIDTPLTSLAGTQLFFRMATSSLFWSVVLGAAYTCVDPLVKTAYTVRLFYADSVSNGYDLLAELASLRRGLSATTRTLLAAVIVLLAGATAKAIDDDSLATVPDNPQAQQMEHSIEKVLARREFSWRLPRMKEQGDDGIVLAFLKSFFDTTGEFISKFFDWIGKLLPVRSGEKGLSGIASFASWVSANSVLLSFVLILVIALVIYFTWRKRAARYRRTESLAVPEPLAPPDLDAVDIAADALSNSEWIELARKMLAEGDLRHACRAIFLASIAALSDRKAVSVARHKTNLDYLREVRRRMHGSPRTIDAFGASAYSFERVWYGEHTPDMELIDMFMRNFETIRGANE